MKTKRSPQFQKRFVQSSLRPLTPQHQVSPAPPARSRNPSPCDQGYRQHQHARCAAKDKPSFIFPLLPRLSHLYQRQDTWSEPAWATRIPGTRSNLAYATIKIGSGRIDYSFGRTHSGTCIPHYLTTVSTTPFCHILGYHVKQGGTLTQASFEALNSTFNKVPGSVSMYCPITQRYRFRGTDYEVAIVQKSCIWLRPTDSSNRNRIPAPRRSASLHTPQHPILPRLISPTRVQIPGSTGITGRPQTHSSRKWIDRQPESVRQFLIQYAHRHFYQPGYGDRSGLVKAIYMGLIHLNQSRPLSDKIKIPSRSSLYRLIDELPGPPRSDEPYTRKQINRASTQEYSLDKTNLIECDTMYFTVKSAPFVPIYLTVAIHKKSGYVLGWHLSSRPPRYHTIMLVIGASMKLATHLGITAPCYIMEVRPGIDRVARILNTIGVKLRVCDIGTSKRDCHVEHFFKNVERTFVSENKAWCIGNVAPAEWDLPTLRISFQKWLDGYHRAPSKSFSPAQILTHFNA